MQEGFTCEQDSLIGYRIQNFLSLFCFPLEDVSLSCQTESRPVSSPTDPANLNTLDCEPKASAQSITPMQLIKDDSTA
jgi:hypothetical protein